MKIKFLILSSILFIYSCTNNDQEILKKYDHNLLNKRVDFNEKKAIEKAEIILDNKIYVWDYWHPVKYFKNIDWGINPYENNSWQLYFHSLRMVGVLSRGYEFNKKEDYILKAMEIVISWRNQFPYIEWKLYKEAWNDHAVANRVLNISHFYFVSFDTLQTSEKKILLEMLKEHAMWLADEKNYPLGNHGIMVDLALLQLSLTYNFKESDEWYEVAIERLYNRIKNEVSSEGVCIENSPFYHGFVMDLINKAIQIHENFDKATPIFFKPQLDLMIDHLIYLKKPNNVLPQLGETYLLKGSKQYSNYYNNEYLNFIESQSKEGKKPLKTSIVYEEAGYAIFREDWGDSLTFDKKTYLIFTNTDISKVHKQNDNLSFHLYANNEDLIVDAGHFSYQKNDTVSYLKSTIAHNTITVDNTNYVYKVNSAEIYDYKITDTYNYLRASYKPNDSIIYCRDLIYIKPNIIFLVDNVKSTSKINKFQQNFNLGKSFVAISSIDNKHKLLFKNNKLFIKQFIDGDKLKQHNMTGNLRGLIADGPMKTRKGTQLEFSKVIEKNHSTFATLIAIQNDFYSKEVNIEDVEFIKGESNYKIKWKLNLKHYEIILDNYEFLFHQNNND